MYVRRINESGYLCYEKLNANIQKSVKLDKKTVEIIERFPGNCFSAKLRGLVEEFDKINASAGKK